MTVAVGVILASVREKRRGAAYARWIHGLLTERPGVEARLLDLPDYPLGPHAHEQMPRALETAYADDAARRGSETIHAHDGHILVRPEYNHGYPGQLKNAIDQVFTGWFCKPVAFASYGGNAGGARAVEQLRNVAVEVRMVPVHGEVNIRLIGLQTDESGAPTDPMYARYATGMLAQRRWWTRATKQARAAEAPPAM